MRIVSGNLRGRVLEAPAGAITRPTTDRVREALFSSLFSLRGGFEGAIVLDAFAGSGALGIEALSRGAQSAVFYERNAKAASVVRSNVSACGLDSSRAIVIQRDVMQAPPSGQAQPFDLVFLDPPYAYDPAAVLGMVHGLSDAKALAVDAIVVYEHDIKAKTEVAQAAEQAGFELVANKKYGKTGVTILECAKGTVTFAHFS